MIRTKTTAGKRRLSRARKALLSELRMLRTHPSAEQLFRLLRARIRNVSLATVYRNLEVLVCDGLVRRLQAGGVCRYDGDLFDHDHLVCEECSKIEDVASTVPREAVRQLASSRKFVVKIVRAEFRGICPECGSKSGSK